MCEQPTGVVTLLFTDVEGSTRLLDRLGAQRFAAVLEEHRTLMRCAFDEHGGYEVDTEGDAFFVAFRAAGEAAAAAEAAQRALAKADWPEGVDVRVRMGMHTGEPLVVSGGYVGLDVHQAARIMAAGHGGQVLLSAATRHQLSATWGTIPLGEHRLKDLLQAVPLFQLVIPGLPTEFPTLRTLGNRATNLPVQRDPLIGRETEVAEVVAMLRRIDQGRLVTLTGPGGTGKTRLSLHVAAELVDDATGGVFFVPLASVTESTWVVPTIVDTLALRAVAGEQPGQLLVSYVADKRMLLVLDNLEQVVEAAADLSRLLDECPNLRLLATSRSRLRVRGERAYPVPPLSLPAATADVATTASSDAVVLFAARAAAACGEFTVTAENAPAIAEVCRRLDGLPLAIELAAAWTPALPIPALLRRLDRALRLLTRGSVDAEHRQQTLRATIEWSYHLLDDAERLLFTRLAVFVDGCRIDAAEAICADHRLDPDDVLPALASLVEKNLLRQRTDPDGEPRFWMLQTIHEFATETLGNLQDAGAIRERHADHYLSLVESLSSAGLTMREEVQRVQADRANIDAALGSALDHRRYDRAAVAITQFWRVWKGSPSGLREGIRWVDLVLPHAGELNPQLQVMFLFAASALFRFAGDRDRSRGLKEEVVALTRDSEGPIMLPHSETALGHALADLADFAMEEGRHGEAGRLLAESLDVGGGARTLASLGSLAVAEGDLGAAERYLLDALERFRATGHDYNYAVTRFDLAEVYHRRGDRAAAVSELRQALRALVELADVITAAFTMDRLAALAADAGDLARAARLYGAANAHGAYIDAPSPLPPDVVASLPADGVAAGRALSFEAAVTYALDALDGAAG